MIDRILDIIFTTHPFERNVLIALTWLRVAVVLLTGVLVWEIARRWNVVGRFLLALVLAWIGALGSADFLEHYLKRGILGYSYNPNVMAQGEFECWTGPLVKRYIPEWNRRKFQVFRFWDGDPGSGRFGGE